MENKIVECEEGRGRRKLVNKKNWKREKAKNLRYMAHAPPTMPECKHNTKAYKCATLTCRDLQKFYEQFYTHKTKDTQDAFLLKYTRQEKPKKNEKKRMTVSIKYFVPRNQDFIRVCCKAFLGILNISKDRVQLVSRKYFLSGEMPKEKRGGDRRSSMYSGRRQNVKRFIESLQVVESHYTREKSKRLYMNSDCSIRKLWNIYNSNCEEDRFRVKYQFFRSIFVNDYNISFCSPSTDACSTCIQLRLSIQQNSGQKRMTDMTTLRVHRLKFKAFYDKLKTSEENVYKLSFDCQKNLILPKLPDQSAYFSRQMYLYNFTVCEGSSRSEQNKNNVSIYTWMENEYPRSSEQIASAIYFHLNNASFEGITRIELYADGCPAQNKNMAVVGMLTKWFHSAPKNISSVEIIYPIVGHSYLPPDRVFGHIEKIVRKKEVILCPDEYFEIFRDYGTVKQLGEEVKVYNWKSALNEIMKSPAQWHFKFSLCKRIKLIKSLQGNILIKGEIAYRSDTDVYRSLLKKGKKLALLKLEENEKGLPLKSEKIKDIDKLLKNHFGVDWKHNEKLKLYRELTEGDINNPIQNIVDECSFEECSELRI